MIKNTDLFYTRAKDYQDKRKGIVDEYEARMKALEDAKGSKYFTDEAKKAEDKRDEALTALKGEYGEYFRISLDAMSKANAARKMTPPTEQLRTLQLLKMKDKPTEAELAAAANTLKGNVTCLSVLTEIAHNAGYMRGYMGYSEAKELPVSDVEDTIKGLHASVREFMDYDTPRAARIVKEHNERMYGVTPNAPELRKRPLFEDKAGCFYEVARMGGDTFTAFCNAVDGE
jgi:hypothetical protein